jgi:Eukaryotic aspartyl protease
MLIRVRYWVNLWTVSVDVAGVDEAIWASPMLPVHFASTQQYTLLPTVWAQRIAMYFEGGIELPGVDGYLIVCPNTTLMLNFHFGDITIPVSIWDLVHWYDVGSNVCVLEIVDIGDKPYGVLGANFLRTVSSMYSSIPRSSPRNAATDRPSSSIQ